MTDQPYTLPGLRTHLPYAAEAAATLGPLAAGHGTPLLAGVLGSTAYGLAHAGSDRDRLGVYAAPTEALLGLDTPTDSLVTHEPGDATLHEARKATLLLLSCNPTVTEALWLPEADYELLTPAGARLRELRSAFLSTDRARSAYAGFAWSGVPEAPEGPRQDPAEASQDGENSTSLRYPRGWPAPDRRTPGAPGRSSAIPRLQHPPLGGTEADTGAGIGRSQGSALMPA